LGENLANLITLSERHLLSMVGRKQETMVAAVTLASVKKFNWGRFYETVLAKNYGQNLHNLVKFKFVILTLFGFKYH
jgi:hypothetical protein